MASELQAIRKRKRWDRISHGFKHTFLRWQFWLGLTTGFPIEHFLWEHVWPFYMVTKWLGL